jgi:hypothetical protein
MGGQTLVGRLSRFRTQRGVVATKGPRRGSGTLAKPPCLRGNADRAPSFELYPGIRRTTEGRSRKTSVGVEPVEGLEEENIKFGGYGRGGTGSGPCEWRT